MTIVTWQSSTGRVIDITPAQEKLLQSHSVWPKDQRGEEYCSVSKGARRGTPTYSDEQLLEMCGVSVTR